MSRARTIAYGGILTALSLVLQLIGGGIGIGLYAAPLLASFCVVIMEAEFGTRAAAVHWLAAGLLSLLLCPDKELALLYLGFFGWYPLAKTRLDRIERKPLRVLCKLVLFNGVILLLYAALLWVLYGGSWDALGFGGPLMAVITLLLGNLCFAAEDLVLLRLKRRLCSHRREA